MRHKRFAGAARRMSDEVLPEFYDSAQFRDWLAARKEERRVKLSLQAALSEPTGAEAARAHLRADAAHGSQKYAFVEPEQLPPRLVPKPHTRLVHVSHSRSLVTEHDPRWYVPLPHSEEHARQLAASSGSPELGAATQ